MSTDSMPMYDSLADQIKYFLLNGGDYHVAPNLGADVLDVVDDFVARFEVLSHDYYRHTQVLRIAHTWLMDVWEHTPRQLFVSPEASCGKTRALTVTRHLVPRPDRVADLSPAGLYHSIDHGLEFRGGRPTILHDEFDTVFPTPRSNEEMRKLINAGHDRYETLNRKIGKETKRFQLYAPMALAGKMTIFDVPDTIRSRSIIIPMQRRLPHEKVERWNRHRSASAGQRAHARNAGIARGGRPRMTLPRCWASRRAGPGVSQGKSRKWCRSVTNILQDCTDRSITGRPGTPRLPG